MKKTTKRVHGGWFLWIGGACFLAGSLIAGSFSLASSAGPPQTVVTQGTPGSSSWPVSASQSGTWQQELTDGISVLGTPSHPLRTDPTGTTTQPVNGNVGITDGTNLLGTPSNPLRTDPTGTTTQPVSGNVGISGSLPAGTNDIGTVNVAAPSMVVGHLRCTADDGTRSCDSSDPGLAAGTIIDTLSADCTVAAGHTALTSWESGGVEITIPVTMQDTFGLASFYSGTLTNVDFPVQSGTNFIIGASNYIASGGNGADCFVTYVATPPS